MYPFFPFLDNKLALHTNKKRTQLYIKILVNYILVICVTNVLYKFHDNRTQIVKEDQFLLLENVSAGNGKTVICYEISCVRPFNFEVWFIYEGTLRPTRNLYTL